MWAAQYSQTGIPAELLRAAQSRASETAQVDWAIDLGDSVRFYTSKIAGDQRLYFNRGDLRRGGLQNRAEEGNPYSYSELRYLVKDGEMWDSIEDAQKVTVQPYDRRMDPTVDGRTAGFLPIPEVMPALEHCFEDYLQRLNVTSYLVDDQGDICEVTAHLPDGIREFKWWLDKQKGWSPVRCAVISEGRVINEAVSTLRNYDGIWFPERVEYHSAERGNSVKHILSATFDKPEHPHGYSPNDLGVLPGTAVADLRGRDPTMSWWDGEQVFPDGDPYFERVDRGEIDLEPYRREAERIARDGPGRKPKVITDPAAGLVHLSHTPGLWEEYVRRFMLKHRLDIPQTRKGWEVLSEAQKAAYQFLDRHARDFERIDRQIEELRTAERADGAGRSEAQAKRETLDAERLRMLEPIDLIFEKQLRARLESLLTPAQRKAGGPSDGSSSASR